MSQTAEEKNLSAQVADMRRELSDVKDLLARVIGALRTGMSNLPNIERRN